MEIKYLLLALPLLLLGCDKPAFHYKDCVKIEDDFYGTTYGIVTEYRGLGYTVLRKIDVKPKEFVVSQNYLTKVEDSFCSDIQLKGD